MTYQTYTNFSNKNEIIQTFWGEIGNYDNRSKTKYYVWEKPANSKFTHFIVFGGGGGGGGGAALNLGMPAYGGNGGAAGGKNMLFIPSTFLPKKLYIAVGNGGAGGAGGVNSGTPASGLSGTNGGDSLVSFIPITTSGINATALFTSPSRGLQVNHKLLFAGGGNGGDGGLSSVSTGGSLITDRGWSPIHYGTNNTGSNSPSYYGNSSRHAINQFVGVPNNNSKFINNTTIFTRTGANTTYQTAINENRLDTNLPGIFGAGNAVAGASNSTYVNFYQAGGGAGVNAAGAGGGVAAFDMLYGPYTYGRPATTSADFGRNGTNFENNFKEINSNNSCNSRYAHHVFIYAGGQGGGSSATVTGGKGGDGAMACGGGGGGAVIGLNTAGAGGNGGPGVVIITSIF